MNSPDWIKKKNATTDSINYDDKCFEYTATDGLNYEKNWTKFTKNIQN